MTVTLEPNTEAKLRELDRNVKAIQDGLDAVDSGRVRPFEDYLSEHRQRFPDVDTELPGLEGRD